MIKTFFKICTFLSLCLTACSKTSENEISEAFFKGKSWTKWSTSDDSIAVYVTGGYGGSFQYGIGYFDNDKEKCYEARFIINEYGSPYDYLRFFERDKDMMGAKKTFNISKFKEGDSYSNNKIVLSTTESDELIMSGSSISDDELDTLFLYNCSLTNELLGFDFFPTESPYKLFGKSYSSQYNNKKLDLVFLDSSRFQMSLDNIVSSGVFTTSHKELTLRFEDKNIFDFNDPLTLNLMFVGKNFSRTQVE